MNTTREQRRAFVLNAKRQLKKGEITKAQFNELKKQIANMGKEQHSNLQQTILEQQGVTILGGDETINIDLETELIDDFTPTDL